MRRTAAAFFALLVLGLCIPESMAQTRRPLPRGIPVGNWVLAPYFESEIDYEDNLFRSSEDTDRETERITTLTAGVAAYLPIRNSMFEIDYEASQSSYSDRSFTRDTSQDLEVSFDVNFGSNDRLTIRENFVRGFSDLRVFDEGGQLTFAGQPYNYNRVDVELSREARGQQGYSIRVSREDLNFETDDPVGFFDYRGFDTAFEYRHPTAGDRWFIAYYGGRRYNQYDVGGLIGVPTRKEESDTLQVGLRGYLGKDQLFVVRLGYQQFEYIEENATGFTGFALYARWLKALGAATKLDVQLNRRPLPSSYDTYYLVNEIQAAISRDMANNGILGFELTLAKNEYGAPIELQDCSTFVRKDERVRGKLFAGWRLKEQVQLKLSAYQSNRSSNCDRAEYDATIVSANLSMGWF